MSSKIYISIVSHNSYFDIHKNFSDFPRNVNGMDVILCILDNVGENKLKTWSEKNQIKYFSDGIKRGYGGNHNKNFDLIKPNYNDLFIVCNPDVKINYKNFDMLIDAFMKSESDIYGVKVFESNDLNKFSSHNRSFPALFDPIISFVFRVKLFENDIDKYSHPDWIGGAFMIFKSESFRILNGFDERFFMYYEDTDICMRAKIKGMRITYDPNFFIIHYAQRKGRKFFNKFFLYNLFSYIKFFIKYPTLKLISLKW